METPKIPHSIETEKYVLGSLLVESKLAMEFCPRLEADDFYLDVHKKIYNAIEKIFKRGQVVEVAKVIEQLKADKQYEATGGNAYLLELAEAIPTYAAIESYFEILREKSIERKLYDKLVSLSRSILNSELPFKDLLEKTEKDVKAIINSQSTSEFIKVDLATENTFKIIEKNYHKTDNELVGLTSGYEELDQITHGFKKGELIILAARPSIGKSAFALNIATKACEIAGAKVAFFSLEMGIDQLIMRLISAYSDVPLNKIITGDFPDHEMSKLSSAKKTIESFNLYLDESTTSDLEDIKVKCRKLNRETPLSLIVIDYLQLMRSRSARSRQEEVANISRGLKLLALELKVPILALSQLSRDIEKRKEEEGKKPILSDLRESGSIEQDADIVMFLHRESRGKGDDRKKSKIQTEVLVQKNRQGATGDFKLVFHGAFSLFVSESKKGTDIT